MGLRLKVATYLLVPVVFLVVAQCGGSPMKVKMGRRVDLNKTPVSSIQASLPKGPAIAPGEKSPLVVTLTEPNGQVLFTEGQGAGKVMWKDLQVTATVVLAEENGILSFPEDPRASYGKVGHVTVTVPSQPNLHAELDVPVRYDFAFVSDFSGRPGASGMNGSDGLNGISGTSGSIDPNNPSRGGRRFGRKERRRWKGRRTRRECAACRRSLSAPSGNPSAPPGERVRSRPSQAVFAGSPRRFADGQGRWRTGGLGREGRSWREGRFGWQRNAQRAGRVKRPGRAERSGWAAGEGRTHHRHP